MLLTASGPHVSFEYFILMFHISNTNPILVRKPDRKRTAWKIWGRREESMKTVLAEMEFE
jgi:hypothetical protein